MLIAELLSLEHAGWQSLCEGTGHEFYPRIMTGDGVMVLAHGQALDRDAVGESLRGVPPWREYSIAGERLLPIDDHAAALLYEGRANRDDREPEFVALMTSVYVRQNGQWRLALYQQTPVPDPGT